MTIPSAERTNLYDLSPARVLTVLQEKVSPPFRAKQIEEWLHVRGVQSFEAMTNLPREVRNDLALRFSVDLPAIVEATPPAPDGSCKYLFELHDGNRVETVYMPMGERASICLSSQAGCAVGCTFCVTGIFGAGRNLAPSEMLGQFFAVARQHQLNFDHVNVVFMGMGEPLLNMDALRVTLESLYRTIAPKRVTVSTSGIIPAIQELSRLERRPNLAVSINAPDRTRREEIMPITKKYPLDELIAVLRGYPADKGREITAEYVLIAGYNDSPADAASLAKLLRGVHAKVNAIPLNEDPNLPSWMKRPRDRDIDAFVQGLLVHGVNVTVRRSKGRDIAAACGQLRGRSEPRPRRG